MTSLTLYRQARVDGGVRTGLDIDGTTQFMDFQAPTQEHDPALLWYIDLRISGPSIPREPESARQWLLEHGRDLRPQIEQAASDLELGFDADLRPFERVWSELLPAAEIRLTLSAARRLEGRQIASRLREVAAEWDRLVRDLAPMAEV